MSESSIKENCPYLPNWVNYGDINYEEHGGYAVKSHWSTEDLQKYPNLSDEYDVFCYIPQVSEATGKVFAAMYCVTASDYENKKVELSSEFDDTPSGAHEWAIAAVLCGACDDAMGYNTCYPTNEDLLISKKEALTWMKDIGIANDFGINTEVLECDEEDLDI